MRAEGSKEEGPESVLVRAGVTLATHCSSMTCTSKLEQDQRCEKETGDLLHGECSRNVFRRNPFMINLGSGSPIYTKNLFASSAVNSPAPVLKYEQVQIDRLLLTRVSASTRFEPR